MQDGVEASPELLTALLEAVGARQVGPLTCDVMVVAAIVRRVTELLLRDALEIADAAAPFDALQRQSWTLVDRDGLYPHDLVRDVLRAEAKWRDRPRYDRLFARVADHVIANLRSVGPAGLPDALFLLADHPLYGRVAAHRNAMLPGPLVPSDIDTVGAMLAPLHGGASVDHVARRVERTYVDPAVKQHAAAVELGLSFATYRRALATGVTAVVDALWVEEIAASVSPG